MSAWQWPILLLPLASLVAATASDPAAGARAGARLAAAAGIFGVALATWASDAFDALVLALVLGMGATVLSFARRALRDEPYQRRFATLGPLLILATAVTTTAEGLVTMAIAWVTTSVLTVALIRTGPATRGDHVRRATQAFLVGDLALVTAVVSTVAGVGSPAVAALLLVIAAAARCASGPFLRWLPDTLAAPTPTSALLHAGIVGSGAIVVIRHGQEVASTPAAAVVLAVAAVAIGGVTCILAEAVMVTRPDVKGQLAWSTIAQLSFTLVLVGLDLHVAAALHLVAHGGYKGALFLGSGSTVRSLVRRRRAPADHPKHRIADLAVGATTAVVIAGTVAVGGVTWTVELLVPLTLAWIAVTCAAGAALRRADRPALAAMIVGAAAATTVGYVLLSLGLKAAVAPSIEVADPTLSPIVLIALLGGLAAVAVTRDRTLEGLWRRVERLGSPRPPRRIVPGPAPRPLPVPPAPAPVAAPPVATPDPGLHPEPVLRTAAIPGA